MSTADWALETGFLHRLVKVLRRAQRGGSFVSLFSLSEGDFVSVVYLNVGNFSPFFNLFYFIYILLEPVITKLLT